MTSSKAIDRQSLFTKLNEERKRFQKLHDAVIARLSQRQLEKFKNYGCTLERLNRDQMFQITKDPKTLLCMVQAQDAGKAVESIHFVLRSF